MGEKFLYRHGASSETAGQLASDADEAGAAGYPHGVSTMDGIASALKASGDYGSASIGDIAGAGFDVLKIGTSPHHYTVVLPAEVTDQVAIVFNRLLEVNAKMDIEQFRDIREPVEERVEALCRTVGAKESDLLANILTVGSDANESLAILRASGRALGYLTRMGSQIGAFELRDFLAYVEYCEYGARDE